MALIQGIDVVLHDRVQTGEDAFHAPVYNTVPVTVGNVLVFPGDPEGITGDTQLHGKRIRYWLCIPKEDTHLWEDRTVEFFGEKWQTVGFPQEWIGGLVPLGWNKRVEVERFG
jgi:hypothetical protein